MVMKFIGAEIRMVGVKHLREEKNGKLVFNGNRISIWQEDKSSVDGPRPVWLSG